MKPYKAGISQVLPEKWIAFASYREKYEFDDENHPLRICKTEQEAEAELQKILEEWESV